MGARKLGPYRLETLLGTGSMGEVFRAYDTGHHRSVAIKLLQHQFSNDRDYLRRFRRESYLAGGLREPHVIPIHDFGELEGRLFIDMRLVDGRSLRTLLKKQGPINPARAVQLIGQVADALDAAHADGLIHRDIKPSNILVTTTDFVYVVDFGIAYTIEANSASPTSSNTIVGTLHYMAPERFKDSHADHRVDIYSLTCLLYECLTASPPFFGFDLPSLMYAHLFIPPPRPSAINSNIPKKLDAVIAKGMAKNIEARFETAADLADATRAALISTGPDRPKKTTTNHGLCTLCPIGTPATHASRTAETTIDGSKSPQHAEISSKAPSAVEPAVNGHQQKSTAFSRCTSTTALITLLVLLVVFFDRDRNHDDHIMGRNYSAGAMSSAAPITIAPAPGSALSTTSMDASIALPIARTMIFIGPTLKYVTVTPNGKYSQTVGHQQNFIPATDSIMNAPTAAPPNEVIPSRFINSAPDARHAYLTSHAGNKNIKTVGILDIHPDVILSLRNFPFSLPINLNGAYVDAPGRDTGTVSVLASSGYTVSVISLPTSRVIETTHHGNKPTSVAETRCRQAVGRPAEQFSIPEAVSCSKSYGRASRP